MKPDYTEAYNNLGIAYGNKNQVDLAIASFAKVIQLEPNYAEAYNNRGIAYGKNGEVDLAIKDFTEAIQLKPLTMPKPIAIAVLLTI